MNWKPGLAAVLAVATWSTHTSAAAPAGYALLDKTVATFETLARGGSSSADLDGALDGMMSLAKKAYAQKQISGSFYTRYTRVVRVLRLTTLKDPEGILTPTIEAEVSSFVRDVAGTPSTSIGDLAEAMSGELDSLKKSLDANP